PPWRSCSSRRAGRTRPPAPGSSRSATASGWSVPSVSCFLTRSDSVKAGPDPFGKLCVDALDPGDLLRAGGLEPAQAAEMPQQVSASARSDAGNVLEPAGVAHLLPTAAMAGDRKAVG